MSHKRQRQVMELLDAVLAQPPQERSAFLAQACAGQPELRREVEAVVESAEKSPDFMEEPAFTVHAEDPGAGRRIGPYQLLRLLGRGGMGAVYLAEREDEFRQQVALKVVKRGMDTDDVVRRFHNERQILAELRHPNVARLLDGGTTPDGLPWFAMEYVEGEPIDRYCDARKLPTRARLELFRKVCTAVHVAHQSLVVHRDLKPGNVLVDAAGEPNLLDFGIAKLLQPDPAVRTDATAAGRPLMTPNYASPEQVRGERVTTASDVYSLGVLLYQLLTGHPPYRLDACSPAEAARVICEEEPKRPSAAIGRSEEITRSDGTALRLSPESVSRTRDGDPRRLRRRLAGDLDGIVLKALRKEPQHRYGSVEQFSADVGRHLAGLPVAARRGTFPYRVGKFVRRNKLVLAAAAVFMLLIGGFTLTLAKSLQRTTEERDRANQTLSFLVQLLEVLQPSTPKPSTVDVRGTLDKGAEEIGEALRDPLDQALVLDKLGRAYRSLGFYDKAQPPLALALEIRRRELGDDDPLVAESLNNLGLLLYEKGDNKAAEGHFRQSLEIKEKLWGREDPRLAASLNNLAMVLYRKGDDEEAERLFRTTLRMQSDPEVLPMLNNLALALARQGAYEEAEQIDRTVLAFRSLIFGQDHKVVANSCNSLGLILFQQSDYGEAEKQFRDALAIRLRIFDPEHPDVARVRVNLGLVLHYQGHLEEAEDQFRQALEVQLSKFGEERHADVAATKVGLAATLAAKGEAAEGERLAREAVATFRKIQAADHWLIAYAESVLGACLTGLGRYSEAEGLLVDNYDRLREARGERAPYTRYVRERLVELYDAWGKPERAEVYRDQRNPP